MEINDLELTGVTEEEKPMRIRDLNLVYVIEEHRSYGPHITVVTSAPKKHTIGNRYFRNRLREVRLTLAEARSICTSPSAFQMDVYNLSHYIGNTRTLEFFAKSTDPELNALTPEDTVIRDITPDGETRTLRVTFVKLSENKRLDKLPKALALAIETAEKNKTNASLYNAFINDNLSTALSAMGLRITEDTVKGKLNIRFRGQREMLEFLADKISECVNAELATQGFGALAQPSSSKKYFVSAISPHLIYSAIDLEEMMAALQQSTDK